MNTTLLIMAAGLGSRYGGNKQIDRIGPNGEILMEYSIHDAVEAGFNKVVFVIRKSMDSQFRELIGDKIARKVQVEYAKLVDNEDASRKMMVEMRDKARKQMDNFYDRIRAGIPLDEIDEAEFKNTKDAFRTAENNLKQIETRGHLPKMPPAKIKEYIQTTFGGMVNEKSTINYRALLENLVDSIRVAPSTVTVKLKVRCSWCARSDVGSIAFIIDFVISRPPSRRSA